MIDAFVFLLSRSFANRMKARLKRLKQPKYLIGAIFGLVYLYGYFFQFLFARGRPGSAVLGGAGSIMDSIGAVILLLMVISAWIFPHERAALIFSEAEIAFLFPAPVGRRALIHYKLLKSQIAILFTVLLLTLITGRLFTNSHAWMRVLGWWVILSTLNLHFLGASLARTLMLDKGISNGFRRALVLLLLAAIAGITVFWARQTALPPSIVDISKWTEWRDYLQALFATPPLSFLLRPFQVVLRPYLANSMAEFARAFLVALGVIAAHYLWVVRSNVAFEEASLEASRRFAEKIALARQGKALDAKPARGRRAPFRLLPVGFQPLAFLWKNLISAQATFRARTLILVALPFLVMAGVMGKSGLRGGMFVGTVTLITLMLLFWSLLVGAQFIRCDFRQDLAAMDVLKLFPLRGWQIVAGELLAPAAILTVVQWALLLMLSLLLNIDGSALHLSGLPLPWLVAAMLLTPLWNGLALLIPNASVLLFPGWFQIRADAPQGIEVTGQRLLLFFGQLVVIGATLVPAALVFSLAFVPLHLADADNLAALAGATGAGLVLAAELALGIFLVGKLFDRFDLAAEQGG